MSKQIAKNTFTGGLQMDMHPLSSQNTVLTNALNATLVTIDGDEMILQNDMGNLKVDSGLKDENGKPIYVGLTPGFIPIGVNTLNGIAYIVSFNPNTQEGEIGTFPSPDYPLCTPSSDCCANPDDPVVPDDPVDPDTPRKTITVRYSYEENIIKTSSVVVLEGEEFCPSLEGYTIIECLDCDNITDKCLSYNNITDGETYIFSVIKDSTPVDPDSEFPISEAVDLGLSVKWAKWNMGAKSTSEYGGYYGWGDNTGKVVSPYANKYAVGNTSTSIAGNPKYDIATAKWGKGWRLPTQAEFEEMIEASNERWTYDISDGIKKYIATFPNGKTLEFPYDGYMNSSCTEKVWDSHGYYWTANATDDLLEAYAFHMSGPRARTFPTSEKYIHAFIRPVYDDGSIPDTDNHEYVDLGLSSLWSTVNLGATKSTDAGNYYAWGETEPKTSFAKENYEHYDSNTGGFKNIGNVISDTEYDAVKTAWGGKWHMPTYYDFQELCEQCTWRNTRINGVEGYMVTGPNGNSIFLPSTGYYDANSTEPAYSDTKSRYLAGTLYTLPTGDLIPNSYAYAYATDIDSNPQESQPNKFYRYWGGVIRPVRTKDNNLRTRKMLRALKASPESEVLAYDVNSSKEGYELHKNLVNKYQPLYNLYKGCNCSNGQKLSCLEPKQDSEITCLLHPLRTTHFNFNLEHPVEVNLQPSYDGSVNIIINDGYNIPRLINSRFSAKENGTWEVPDRHRNTNNIYTVYEGCMQDYKEPMCKCDGDKIVDGVEDIKCGCTDVSCKQELENQSLFDISTSLSKRISTFPITIYNGVLNTGNLPVGNYTLYFKYCDEDGNETDFVGESGIISIFKGNDKDPFSIDGGERDMDSNKSINITLKYIDQGYSFVKVYYSRTSAAADENRVASAYEIIKTYPVDNGECNIIISGDEEKNQIPLTSLSQQLTIVNSAETEVQIANRLFLGNIKTQVPNYKDLKDISLRVIPYIRRQEAKNKIGHISPQTYLDDSGISDSNTVHEFTSEYYNTKNIYYNVGYWNEEYYRLGIVYMYEDGSLSPVFNILGYRTADNKYSMAQSFSVLDESEESLPKLFNVPPVYIGTERNYLSIDESGNTFEEGESQIISPASGVSGVTQINTKGVINIVDSELDSGKNAREYLYNVRVSMNSEIIDYLKNVLCIKGFFIVRQKRIPTILAQGYTLPWDKEAKVPIIEHWNTRLMPTGWKFDQTFKDYKANDAYGNNFTWHYYWNSFVPNQAFQFENLRCYEVESFLDQLSDGGRHLDADDGYDYGHPSDRKLMHHYLPRMHDIPFICVDQKMLASFEELNSDSDISSSNGYIQTYKLSASYDNGRSYSSLDSVVSKLLFDNDISINTQILLQETKGSSTSYTSFSFSGISQNSVVDYDVIEQYITAPSAPSNVGELGLNSTEITINGQQKNYQEGDTSWNAAVSAINSIYSDTNLNYTGTLNIYRFLVIVVTTAVYEEENGRVETKHKYYPLGDSIQLVSNYKKIISDSEEEAYDNINGLIGSLYDVGYLQYREYFRDQFVDTIDGKVTQNNSTRFTSCGSYKDLQRVYNDGKYIRRFGNYYMLWKIRKEKWKEIDSIGGADEQWTKALQKHYGDLYRHVDGNQLTAICPEFEVRQPFFNQLFTGSEYPVRYTVYQHGILHRDTENGRGNERHYYPKVERDDIYCPSNTHDFDKFGAKSGMKYKICSVTDNVPIVAVDNTIFQSVLGSEQEAYRIAYINEEHAGKAQWTKDDNHDNHFYCSENRHDWNLARGIFSPYLGIVSKSVIKGEHIEQTERDRRYCRTFNIYTEDFEDTDMQFNIRFQDSSSYYPISERICFNYNYSDYIPEYKNNEGIIYDLYRGDCFLCTFTHRLNRNFNDPVAPTNDKIVDEATWIKHYQPDEDAQNSDITQISKINRGDVNAVKLGSWITIKVRSSYNLSIRSLDERYTTEAAMMGRARGFYPLQQASADGGYKIPNSYLINDGFGSTVGEKLYFTLPEAPYYNNVFEDRIVYSDINIQDAYKNGYRIFKASTITDYTKQYGKIVKLVDWYGHILCIFEHGVGILPVNERVESGEGIGGPVFIDNNKVLPDVPSMISDKFGSQWKDSVIKTPYAVYGVDTSTKKIWKITGSTTLPTLSVISDFKIENFLKENLPIKDNESDVYVGLKNVKTHYNQTKSDIIFTFYMDKESTERRLGPDDEQLDEHAWSICLNEITSDQSTSSSGNFVTFYSWIPLESFNLNNKFYSFDREMVRGILSFAELVPIDPSDLIKYIGRPVYNEDGTQAIYVNYCGSEQRYAKKYSYPNECVTSLSLWEHNNPFVRPLPTHWYGKQHPFEFEFMVIDDPSVQKIWEDLKIISNNAEPESFHFSITGDNYEFTNDIPNIYYRQEATKEIYKNLGSHISYNENYQKVHPNQQIKSTIFPLYYNRLDTYDRIYDDYQQMTGNYVDYQNLSGTEVYRNPRSRKFELVTHIKNTPIDGQWVRLTEENYKEYFNDRGNVELSDYLEERYNEYYNSKYSKTTSCNRNFNTLECYPKIKKERKPDSAFLCSEEYWYYIWVPQSRLRGNSHYKEDKWNIQIPNISFMQKNENRWIDDKPTIVLNQIPNDIIDRDLTYEKLPNTYNSLSQVSTNGWTFRKETKIRDKYCKIKVRYSGEDLAIISAVLTTFNISYA